MVLLHEAFKAWPEIVGGYLGFLTHSVYHHFFHSFHHGVSRSILRRIRPTKH